jgi:hypothetical protein
MLWLVGSDLVRFALLERGIISPTFKYRVPCAKAAIVAYAAYVCESPLHSACLCTGCL